MPAPALVLLAAGLGAGPGSNPWRARRSVAREDDPSEGVHDLVHQPSRSSRRLSYFQLPVPDVQREIVDGALKEDEVTPQLRFAATSFPVRMLEFALALDVVVEVVNQVASFDRMVDLAVEPIEGDPLRGNAESAGHLYGAYEVPQGKGEEEAIDLGIDPKVAPHDPVVLHLHGSVPEPELSGYECLCLGW